MKKNNFLASERPLAFSFTVIFVFILMILISSIIVSANWPADTNGWYFGSTIGRLVSIIILLIVVSRLGWIHSAGFTSLGQRQIWMILLIPLAYSIVTSLYAFTGNFELDFSDPTLAGSAILFLMFHAFLEEVTFRGLILPAFLCTWGSTNRGVIKSALVSSIFFAGYHIPYLAGEPFLIVLFRMIVSFLLGMLFGALVLQGRSIYPAVFFHGILNVSGYLNLANNATEPSFSSWLLLTALTIPIAMFGIYLLRNLPQPTTQANIVFSKNTPS